MVADEAATDAGTPVEIDVLVNDSDPEGDLDSSSVVVTTEPSNGTVTVDLTTGVITYTPADGFAGTDTFTYEACDDGTPALCDTAVVTVEVTADPPANQPPVWDESVVDATVNLPVDGTPDDLSATDPDSDPLTYGVVSGDLPGDLALGPDGTWTGTVGGVAGTYPVVVEVCDSHGACVETTYTIVVLSVPPTDTATDADTSSVDAAGREDGTIRFVLGWIILLLAAGLAAGLVGDGRATRRRP